MENAWHSTRPVCQRTILCIGFSTSIFTWVQRIKLRLPGECGKYFTLWAILSVQDQSLSPGNGSKDGHSGQVLEIFRKLIKLLDMWMGRAREFSGGALWQSSVVPVKVMLATDRLIRGYINQTDGVLISPPFPQTHTLLGEILWWAMTSQVSSLSTILGQEGSTQYLSLHSLH